MLRRVDPVRQWKLSQMDLASLDKWDDYTEAKEAMFREHRHRRRAVDRRQEQRQEAWPDRGDALRARRASTTRQGAEVVGTPDPLIVGPPDTASKTAEARCLG